MVDESVSTDKHMLCSVGQNPNNFSMVCARASSPSIFEVFLERVTKTARALHKHFFVTVQRLVVNQSEEDLHKCMRWYAYCTFLYSSILGESWCFTDSSLTASSTSLMALAISLCYDEAVVRIRPHPLHLPNGLQEVRTILNLIRNVAQLLFEN